MSKLFTERRPEEDDGRLHIPKDGLEAIGDEVRAFIAASIRRRNGVDETDPREVCNQCIVNAAGSAILAQIAADVDQERPENTLDRMLVSGSNFSNLLDALAESLNLYKVGVLAKALDGIMAKGRKAKAAPTDLNIN